MALRGQTMSHPKTGERVTFGSTAAETGGRFCELELFAEPETKPAAAHIHPDQAERFTIHSGRVRVRLGGAEHDHGAGETVVIPPGTPHTWTAIGDEELHLTVRIEPALNAEGFFEDFFTLAETGKPTARECRRRFASRSCKLTIPASSTSRNLRCACRRR